MGEGIAQGCLIYRSRKRAKGRKPRKKGGNRKYGTREEWTPSPPQTMALPLSMVLVGSQISGSFLPSQNGM